ncbi:LtfC-like domain-containing protein [Nocardia sp. NPDC003999]
MPMGWRTVQDPIDLNAGDFIASRTRPGGIPLPPGTTAEIVWETSPTPKTWTAVVDGATLSWRVEAEEVADIPTGTAYRLWIHYPNPAAGPGATDDYAFAEGVARRT